MQRQLTQMVRLVDDLLDVSRITTGKLEVRKERVTLQSVIRNAIETARPFIDLQKHAFEQRLPAEPLVVPVAELLLLGLVDAPPPALFFSSVLIEAEPEAAPEGEVVDDGLELDEDEAAPEGEDGVVEGDVVEPDEDAAPEDGVLVSRAVRPALLSPQAARPRARETAAARMESFMCSPPWLG